LIPPHGQRFMPLMLARAAESLTETLLVAIAAVAALALLPPAPAAAQLFDTRAPYAILMDYDSGTVLFEKNADVQFEPASMAKLMTAEYTFHELKEGSLSLDDEFTISEHAWRDGGAPSGGSTMYAEIHSRIAVRYLLRGLLVQSGNDAAIALAEGIAGSEAAFADRLTRRAASLGLKHSRWQNANGLHDPDQMVTARDMAILARHIIRTYPEYYKIFSEPEFTWNNIRQRNRNPLLDDGIGVDGLKTGYIKESGYNITASAKRNDQRLILVLGGLDSEAHRELEATKLLDWGFRNFVQVTAFEDDEVVAEADVYGGDAGGVPLKAEGAIRILIPRDAGDTLRARVVYQGPLMAPVQEGTRVGAFKVWAGDRLIQEVPLYTAAAVGRGTLHSRALDALTELLFGWL
jgi:D-alanyl-D-alanine carboxypeptidase (penicillin-binding protein 5/6)